MKNPPSPRPRASRRSSSPVSGGVGVRTCVGCGTRGEAKDLVRLVLGTDGSLSPRISISSGARPAGRSAHVHPRKSCVVAAASRGLARSFRRKMTTTPRELATSIVAEAERCAKSALARAVREGAVTAGPPRGEDIVLVASDASEDAATDSVAKAVAEGRAVVMGDRRDLGALLRDAEASVAVIRHARLGRIMATARALGDSVRVGLVPEDG